MNEFVLKFFAALSSALYWGLEPNRLTIKEKKSPKNFWVIEISKEITANEIRFVCNVHISVHWIHYNSQFFNWIKSLDFVFWPIYLNKNLDNTIIYRIHIFYESNIKE